MGLKVLAWQRRAHRTWRRRFRPLWRRQSAIALPLLAISVLVLGTIGWEDARPPNHGFWNSLYHAVQLFGLNGEPGVPLRIPPELQIARFLAPALLFFAGVQALIRLSREPFQVAIIRLLAHDHVVIAGLGEIGSRLAVAFDEEGAYVVGIEVDPLNPHVADLRNRGIRVITGSAASSRVLGQAKLDRARHLIVTCGRDALNVDIAAVSQSVVRGREGVLTVFAHLRDLRLWRMLKAEAVAMINDPEYRLEFFNVYVTAARVMLERHPPFDPSREDPANAHICFLGLEGVGEELVLSVAGTWRNAAWAHGRLPVTLAGPTAHEDEEALLARHPELAEILDLRHHRADVASAAIQGGSVLLDEDGRCSVTRVYVALSSDAEALAAALGLHGSPATMQVPIIVAITDSDAGTAEVLSGEKGRVAAVEPFGVFNESLTPAIVVRGMNEALARSKHAEYIATRRAQGTYDPTESALSPWEQLPEAYKDSNRRFADRIGRKLQEVGWGIIPAPLIDSGGALATLSEEELEGLAQIEHDGWVEDLMRDGWKPTTGPKDPHRKLHPLLVGWDDLSEDERDKDRNPMRELPGMLAHAGFELYRQSDGVPPARTGAPTAAGAGPR